MAWGWGIDWVRASIIFTLSVLHVYPKLRNAKSNKIYRRVARYKLFMDETNSPLADVATTTTTTINQDDLILDARYQNQHNSTTLRNRLPVIKERQVSTPHQQTPTTTNGNHYNHRQSLQRLYWPAGNVGVTYEYELIEAKSNLPDLEPFLTSWHKFAIYYNWYLLVKHLIVCLLRLDSLAHLRYLDCYLVGRFIVNGRVVELASYCACFLITFRLLWHYLITYKDVDFKMPCFEFLLMSQIDVARWAPVRRKTRIKSTKTHPLDWLEFDIEGGKLVKDDNHGGKDEDPYEQEKTHSTILEYYNPFNCDTDRTGKCYGLRPNRTQEAWMALAKSTLTYYKIFALIFACLIALFMSMVLPVALNKRGFEYNYRYCINYLTIERIKESNTRATFLRRHRVTGLVESLNNMIRPEQDELGGALGRMFRYNVSKNFRLSSRMDKDFIQSVQDLVPMNPYHVVRILLDFVDSAIIYFAIAWSLAARLYMTLLASHDIVLYCSAMNARLSSLIDLLRSLSSVNLNVNENYYYYTTIVYNQSGLGQAGGNEEGREPQDGCLRLTDKGDQVLRAKIHEVQAMIADLFTMIDSYNKFTSLSIGSLLAFWLGYSALVSSWLFIPGNNSPKTEWYAVHLAATVIMFALMYQCSNVKTECRRLYKHIVIAMALDESLGPSKATWSSLLKFYTPVPMYCFTIIKSVELSMMFGLQLIVWLFSALVVASSFFTVYHID